MPELNKHERTLILLKPDAVQRKLVGRIIDRFESKGFNLVAMKLIAVSPFKYLFKIGISLFAYNMLDLK